MAKIKLSDISDEEKQRLAGLSEAEAKAAINAMDLSMPDSTLLKASVAGLRAKAAKPAATTNLAEEAALALGIGGWGVTAAAVTRVAELLKGMQMRYEAFLKLEELAGRLRTRLGDKYRIARLDPLSVALTSLGDGTRLCEVRFAPEDGASATSVTISRPNTDKAKDAVGNLAGEALQRAVSPGGFNLGSLISMGQKAVSAAVETAGDLADVEAVIEAIEAYGAEQEDLAASARREAKDKKEADAKAADLKKRQVIVCRFCGSEAPEDAVKCPNCSGSPR